MVFVRENTEDAYVGHPRLQAQGPRPRSRDADHGLHARGVERAIRYAFELARKRNKQTRRSR
jgi:3-isopropylmalate dehydrogenase